MPGRQRSRPRAAAILALALPALSVAVTAFVFLTRDTPTQSACPELDLPLGDIAEGPRGWSARARYEQWPEGGQCLGSLGVSFFAPGGSWEDEAWAPAAHAVVRHGLLPPPTRERAWLTWSDDGGPLLFGFADAATPLVVDALPDASEGLVIRRCAVVEGVDPDGRPVFIDERGCAALRVEME